MVTVFDLSYVTDLRFCQSDKLKVLVSTPYSLLSVVSLSQKINATLANFGCVSL